MLLALNGLLPIRDRVGCLVSLLTFFSELIAIDVSAIGEFQLADTILDSPYINGVCCETQSFYSSNIFTGTVVPVPAAIWLFGSGLTGLIGFTRSKKVENKPIIVADA